MISSRSSPCLGSVVERAGASLDNSVIPSGLASVLTSELSEEADVLAERKFRKWLKNEHRSKPSA